MIYLRHRGRIKTGVLVSTLCVCVLVLGAEVTSYTHAMGRTGGSQSLQTLDPAIPPPPAGLSEPHHSPDAPADQCRPGSQVVSLHERSSGRDRTRGPGGHGSPAGLRRSHEHVCHICHRASERRENDAGDFNEFQFVERQMQKHDPAGWAVSKTFLLTHEAIGYLRLGEQQNCCAANNANSCLSRSPEPGSTPGSTAPATPSSASPEALQDQPERPPGALAAQYRLYDPRRVSAEASRARWLIPLKNFGGDYPMKKFYNAAPQMGLDLLGWAGSVTMEDFEGNGLLDLMISSCGLNGQLRYFHNNGDGTFTERTQEAGLIGEVGGLNIITTDYNNDGRPDVLVLRGGWMDKSGHYPLSLLRNDGNGHFTDVTIQAGLLTFGPTQTAVAFDYNGDGLLDLFVGYEFNAGRPGPLQALPQQRRRHLHRCHPASAASTSCASSRPSSAPTTPTAAGPASTSRCHGQPNILLRNDGPAGADQSPTAPWKFTDVSRQAGRRRAARQLLLLLLRLR